LTPDISEIPCSRVGIVKMLAMVLDQMRSTHYRCRNMLIIDI